MDNNASIDKAAIDANIARTVDRAALRKVRNLVDNFERDERAAKAQQFRLVFWLVVAIGVFFVTWVITAKPAAAPPKVEVMSEFERCMVDTRTQVRLTRERELMQANPALTKAEAIRLARGDDALIHRAALERCERDKAN
ncbi:MAG: hypothetical protein SF172_14120 [Burkholderiales bacterium]|nr:hypothetical protein [Burkholderiales bacterium]